MGVNISTSLFMTSNPLIHLGEKMKSTLVALAIATLSASAMAQSVNQFYGEVTYDTLSIKDTSSTQRGTVKPTATRLTVGNVVMDNLAVEASYIIGAASDTYSADPTISVKIKDAYSIALRPFINVTPELEVFGRIGKSHSNTEAKAGATTVSGTSNDMMYGVGAAYTVAKDVKAVVDYTMSPESDGSKTTRMGVGVRFNF